MLLVFIAGCATSSTLGVKLDPRTSATLTFSPTPMILYRDVPGHAAYARNFVSLGPIQTNRSGNYQYFIWLGIWNTHHRLYETDARDGFDSIILLVDGEPLVLDAAGWTPETIGASEPVYVRQVASALDAYYQVTIDQIRLLADAEEVSLKTTGFSSHSFELWDRQSAAREGLRDFLSATY
ncbi:MAG: hypothetical protein K0U72_12350 [Gammaproteobacteria bacterium]|nr:hypothetical protein [Gammaproteobacteria bacterium]